MLYTMWYLIFMYLLLLAWYLFLLFCFSTTLIIGHLQVNGEQEEEVVVMTFAAVKQIWTLHPPMAFIAHSLWPVSLSWWIKPQADDKILYFKKKKNGFHVFYTWNPLFEQQIHTARFEKQTNDIKSARKSNHGLIYHW